MNKKPKYWSSATRILSKKDYVMKKLILKYQDKTLSSRRDLFYSLCKSIIGQQISVAAANSVFKKFSKMCNGRINPSKVVILSPTNLKKCGLSRQKVKGIKELAEKFKNKSFDTKKIIKMNDEDAIDYLSNLRQIGRWSAEMILIFNLNRSNI